MASVVAPEEIEESCSVVVVSPVNGSVKGDEPTVEDKDVEKSDKVTGDAKDAGEGDDAGKEEKVLIGTVCDTMNLYQKFDKHDRPFWTDEYPDDLQEAAENEKTIKFAVLVRKKRSYDSRKNLEIDSIIIQSPYLKSVLHKVLFNYPGVTTTLQRLAFSAPFKPFVHRWNELTKELENDEHDEQTRAHIKLLYDVLYAELKDTINAAEDYRKNGVITYEHVWTLFQPGATVFASRYGRPVALRLEQAEYGKHCKFGPCFILSCDRVDWDGARFGFNGNQQFVFPFLGTVPITDLECFPLDFHKDAPAIRELLLARGRVFEQLAGYHYKMYDGPAIEMKQWGPALATVESRIIIDAYAHGKSNPNQDAEGLKPLNKVTVARRAQASGDPDEDYNWQTNDDHERWDYGERDADKEEIYNATQGKKLVPLTEEQLLMCSPLVKGYALKSKKWLEFFVDNISEVVFNERAFDSLVLPQGHKNLILAFAQTQVKYKDRFDDVISGKGKGIIMLLSGGPGIGKTLTAESVAEEMRVPLYVMSAGDLGSYPSDVEENLKRILEMVAKWDAVLLLDECDVFLEARTSADLNRNRIVSIFLRTLEYYEGILFLTTNRVADMDDAFHSRIHLSLEYPKLDEDARRKVWHGFLERSVDVAEDAQHGQEAVHGLSGEEIDKLAKLDLNGRVIKNVLKTGNLLACHMGQKMTFQHLKTVLNVEGHKIE